MGPRGAPVHNPSGPIEQVTVRMLLAQLPACSRGRGRGPAAGVGTVRTHGMGATVAMMPLHDPRVRTPGAVPVQHPGFVYAARIIESITGDPWQGYIQKNVRPAGGHHVVLRARPGQPRATGGRTTTKSAGTRSFARPAVANSIPASPFRPADGILRRDLARWPPSSPGSATAWRARSSPAHRCCRCGPRWYQRGRSRWVCRSSRHGAAPRA